MGALAEFVMKGRAQAILVSVIASFIPLMFWISGAVVSLTTMRKGLSEGLVILLFAAIAPFLWMINAKEPTPFLVLVLAWGMALVLRSTVSWDRTLILGTAGVLVLAYLLPLLGGDLIQQLVAIGIDVIKQLQPTYYAQLGESPEHVVQGIMVGSLCVSLFMFSLLSLMLGRSWQARLFNPGGFRQEFHQLRLSRQSCVLLLLMMMVFSYLDLMAIEATLIAMVPFSVAGLALVHGSVAKRNLSKGWLITFYVVSFLLGPSLLFLLVFLAVADAWMDFRSRIKPLEN